MISNFEFGNASADFCDHASTIIANFVRKADDFSNFLLLLFLGISNLSFTAAFINPAAFFVSTGLMLAACTLIITSVGASTTGLANLASPYPEGFEYEGMQIASISLDGADVMLIFYSVPGYDVSPRKSAMLETLLV